MRFEDKELLNTYLKITKDVLVPSLESQTNKRFIWGAIVFPEDIVFIRNTLKFDFMPFLDCNDLFEYCKLENVNIQTRHDMDDYMSPDYVEEIQNAYKQNIKKYNTFLIQAQPVKLDYHTDKESAMAKYTDTRNSMFLSICQKELKHHIYEIKHVQMYKIADTIITLDKNLTKWVIHGNNLTIQRRQKTENKAYPRNVGHSTEWEHRKSELFRKIGLIEMRRDRLKRTT